MYAIQINGQWWDKDEVKWRYAPVFSELNHLQFSCIEQAKEWYIKDFKKEITKVRMVQLSLSLDECKTVYFE